jgi:hypothetical protein
MKVGSLLVLVLFTFNVSHSQSNGGRSGGSNQGSLTVTATVEPSVSLIMEPDGKRDVVVANAPDSKESFSRAAPPKGQKSLQGRSRSKRDAGAEEKKPAPAVQSAGSAPGDASVLFTFPTAAKQFEVTKKTVTMDVTEGGKTERRPVTVTTIVVQ